MHAKYLKLYVILLQRPYDKQVEKVWEKTELYKIQKIPLLPGISNVASKRNTLGRK